MVVNIDCELIYFLNLYVGATANESKMNFIGWLDTIVLGVSRRVKQSDDCGTKIETTYEGMSCSDLQKIISILGRFGAWHQQCEANGISVGRMLVVTGSESNMTVTQQHCGPFN